MKTKIANFQEVTINHLMSHIAAQKAFMNMKHPDLKNILGNEENNSQWGFFLFFFVSLVRNKPKNHKGEKIVENFCFKFNGNHRVVHPKLCINILKKVPNKAIWADKKWGGFWQISRYIK